jgi:hypothetical protein
VCFVWGFGEPPAHLLGSQVGNGVYLVVVSFFVFLFRGYAV